jgi:lactate dehydrogenase-like 2-hydroxyacid dehydrogenase
VFEHEPTVPTGLLELESGLLTSHIGSATRETRGAMTELAARNVVAVLSGRLPMTPIPD